MGGMSGGHRWWHAWGKVMGEDDYLPGCFSLVVIGPAEQGQETAESLTAPDWGTYLASWDHAPSDAEKDAVTPEEYRQEEPARGCVMAAQPIPVDEAIARFGESGLASCSCEHPLISHRPPVYECLTSISTSWGPEGMPTQGYRCPCEQFEPSRQEGRLRREGRAIFYRLGDEDADYPGEEVLLARIPDYLAEPWLTRR